MTNPVSNALSGLYYAFSIPLGLLNLVLNVIEGNAGAANTPQIDGVRAPREWYSQPRIGSDPTVEVLQINFKLPLSISSIEFDALRVPSVATVWYQDRNNNWIPLTDMSANPLQVKLSYSAASSWFDYKTEVYPVIATAVQIRLTRVQDPQVGNNPYVVGIKETLIRRNVYSLEQSTAAIEQQQDIIGNTITSYIENWDAADAIDDDPSTYWKSMALPSPNAVVALYLDYRLGDGSSQMIDVVDITPVYDGQTLNLYYSNDDTVGTRIISSVQIPPDDQVNASWSLGTGVRDVSPVTSTESALTFPVAFGPWIAQPMWIGIEWTPDFDPANGPATNPILFAATPEDPTTAAAEGQFWPVIYYDVGAGVFTLEFTNGTTTHVFHQILAHTFSPNVPLEIVVGWAYGPDVVFMSVHAQSSGDDLGTAVQTVTSPAVLPHLITLDGSIGYQNFRGLMTALVIKAAPWGTGWAAFQNNSTIYANPNPVLPDSQGNYPSTSLDDAIFAVDWTTQQFPIGGGHDSWYENKTWTPIFANYITSKGPLFLPQAVTLKYLKLEFTNLTAEPYPVYDAGIQVSYDTFPAAVVAAATNNRPGGLLGVIDGVLTLGADIVTAALGAINWLNPQTIQNMTNANFGNVVAPVQVVTGFGRVTQAVPNTSQTAINAMYRSEQSSPYIYNRSMPNATFLAGQQVASIIGEDNTQTLEPAVDADTLGNSFTPVVTTSRSNVLPQQGTDWWLFPGANLKMPASVMNGLFGSTQVVTARGPSLATRVRFSAVQVHRYDVATVTLDAAVAYFAGLSEVSAYLRTYVAGNDPLSFSYAQYDPVQFSYGNIHQETTGPLTTAGSPYVMTNPNFLPPLELQYWTPTGPWQWDATHGVGGDPCAMIVVNGNPVSLLGQPVPVNPSDQIVLSVWMSYYGAVSTSSGHVTLAAVGYLDGVAQGPISLASPPSGNGPVFTAPSGNIDGRLATQLIGTYTVPASGIDAIAVNLEIDGGVTAGTFYWNNVDIDPADGIEGTVSISVQTSSTFDRVTCEFTDSGMVNSDGMWAQLDPLDTNINNLQLAYYVNTYPAVIPSGVWADTFAEWADTTIEWGEPLAEVAINVDPNLIYDGNRALHFTRAAGAGNAGVTVVQQTNMVAHALARLNCVFFKPTANANQILLQLRRVSDGVVIHSETFTPIVGYWYTYQSDFFELPDSTDQVYTIEFYATGDAADEVYLSNLFTSVAMIRYFVQLGGSGTTNFDVTPLRYGGATCTVSTTTPVNELALTTAIWDDSAWAYGVTLTPKYLK